MENSDKLERNIQTIFSEESYRNRAGTVLNPDFEPFEALSILYDKNLGNKEEFVRILLKNTESSQSYLSFKLLLKKKDIGTAFNLLKPTEGLISSSGTEWTWCLKRLYELLDMFIFSEEELNEISERLEQSAKILIPFIKKHLEESEERSNPLGGRSYHSSYVSPLGEFSSVVESCKRLLTANKVKILKEELKGEILQKDIEIVVYKIKQLSLNERHSGALKKLMTRYYEAEDDIDFAMYGGYVRTFLSDLIKEICINLSKNNTKKPSIRAGREDGDYREYLKEIGFLSEREWKFLSSFYGLVSEELNRYFEKIMDH